ncbi:MAG TPA: peptide-methionine (S)-S-oxide reductase MsrA [Myxococcota bacterium]|nr:peptide-methionine (S)-S-oxide reductase MsrA [Myxococcota bacterium]
MRTLLLALFPLAAAADGTQAATKPAAGLETAIFAGGCFWCMEAAFDGLAGVVTAESGYTGGKLTHPTYQQVGHTEHEHVEAVRVVFDPKKVSYDELLFRYWRNVDPFDLDGQFCDQGTSYQPVVFVDGAAQRTAAEASRKVAAEQLGKAVEVPIRDAATFWLAEDYHQDYHSKNPYRYSYYRWGCGRDARLDEVWGAQARGGAAGH